MAGKVWSPEEEAYFWTHVVPFSRRRRGIHLANPELTFQQLGERMQAALGDRSRRIYTALCLEEHFYLNIEGGRTSRNARRYVKAHKALADEFPSVPEKVPRSTHELNDDVEPTHPATKPGAEMDMELGGDENAAKREAVLELARIAPPEGAAGVHGKAKGKRRRQDEDEEDDGLPQKRMNRRGLRAAVGVNRGRGDGTEKSGDSVYVADGDPSGEATQDTGQAAEDATEPTSPKDKGGGDARPAEDARGIARAAFGATRRLSVRDLLSEDPPAGENGAEEREVERAARGLMGLIHG